MVAPSAPSGSFRERSRRAARSPRDRARGDGRAVPRRRGPPSRRRARRRAVQPARRSPPRRQTARRPEARRARPRSRPRGSGTSAIGEAGTPSATRAIRPPQVRQAPPARQAARLSGWPSSSIPAASSLSGSGSTPAARAPATSPSAITAALEPSPRARGIRSVKAKLRPFAGARRSNARTPRWERSGSPPPGNDLELVPEVERHGRAVEPRAEVRRRRGRPDADCLRHDAASAISSGSGPTERGLGLRRSALSGSLRP